MAEDAAYAPVGGVVGLLEPTVQNENFISPSFGEDEQKDDSLPPESMPKLQTEKGYKLFPWQEYDPNAIPDIRL